MTGGDVTIRHARPGHLKLPLTKLEAAGALIEDVAEGIRVKADGLAAVDVVTLPYPGFPTDLQPQLMVAMSQAEGTSIITENVFESRFTFVDQLLRLGAEIELDGHHAVIRGPRPLRGTEVEALDVRAGAACILAGLVADGETTVVDIHHVDRGYAELVPRLRGIGADILRVDEAGEPVEDV
jgi:UDP-N-acetylglucosamine 1-carboxyvinyltransferase